MGRIIVLVDLVVILTVLWFAVMLCIWGYKQFKKIGDKKCQK